MNNSAYGAPAEVINRFKFFFSSSDLVSLDMQTICASASVVHSLSK